MQGPELSLLVKGADVLGIPLTELQLHAFRVYAEELIRWNQRFNLTAIVGWDEIQTKHFVDSLTGLLAFPGVSVSGDPGRITKLSLPQRLRVIDVGTGAGFPGLPLKIACPDIGLVLLESVAKKTRFLSFIVQELGLADVQIVTGRAEEVAHAPQHRERYDVVVARAVARLNVLAELCLPFVGIGGRFIAYKSGDVAREIQAAGRAIEIMGGRFRETVKIELPGVLDLRYLIVVDKASGTPSQYPRRPGLPVKRPL